MNLVFRTVRTLSQVGKWVALITMTSMMLFITYAVINRQFFRAIVGDVELVQLGMVVLIMFGLAYSQSVNAHVSIGLFVDRLPMRIQHILDVIAYLATFIICITVSFVTFGVAISEVQGTSRSTSLLEIPYYPFRFIIAIGFMLWAMEAMLKIFNALSLLKKGS